MNQRESGQEEAPGKPGSFLFLLWVTREESNTVEMSKTGELVVQNDVGHLMRNVTVPSRLFHQRIENDGMPPIAQSERASEECVVLNSEEFLEFLSGNERVGRPDQATEMLRESDSIHPVTRLEVHGCPSVLGTALGLRLESTAERHVLFLVD